MSNLYKNLLAFALAMPVCVAGLSYSSLAQTVPNMPSDLVAYYTFDNSSNLGKDATANANDLDKTVNSAKISTVDGVDGKAVYFGGSAGLAIADQTNADSSWKGDFMDNIGGAFTISYYAKIDTSKAVDGANTRVFCNGVNGGPGGSTSLVKYVADGNKVQFISAVGGTDWWSGCATLENAASNWHHYVMIYDPDNEKFSTYVDGDKKVELYADSDENLSKDWNFTIGGCWSQMSWFSDKTVTTESFIGSVDEFKVFNKAIYDMNYIETAGHPTVVASSSESSVSSSSTSGVTNTAGSSSAASTDAINNAKTGDAAAPLAVAVLMIAAAGAMLVCKRKVN